MPVPYGPPPSPGATEQGTQPRSRSPGSSAVFSAGTTRPPSTATYLITGGAGFIGSHLTDALLARGDRVISLDNLSTGRLRNLDTAGVAPNFRFVHGTVLDELVVDELVNEADVVVHLAAVVGVKLVIQQPLRSFITNIRGTEHILDAAHRYRRKVFLASTSEIYGKNNADALAEDADRLMGSPAISRWAYSTAKSVDEVLGFAYHEERGLDVIIGRLFNTVGPRQTGEYGMVLPTLVRQAVAGEVLTVHGTGQQTRCFCHVHDTVRAILGLVDDERSVGEAFNVGSSDEITIRDLAERIIAMSDSESTIELMPYDKVFATGFEDMLRRVPDTRKVRTLIGWRPTRTLTDILEQSIAEARLEAGRVSTMLS